MRPTLQKAMRSLDFPLTVRDAPDEIPFSAQVSKPEPNPASRDSPRNTARQQMTSRDPGGSKRLDLATQEWFPRTLVKVKSQSFRAARVVYPSIPWPSALQKACSNRQREGGRIIPFHSQFTQPAGRTLRRSFLIPVFGAAPF